MQLLVVINLDHLLHASGGIRDVDLHAGRGLRFFSAAQRVVKNRPKASSRLKRLEKKKRWPGGSAWCCDLTMSLGMTMTFYEAWLQNHFHEVERIGKVEVDLEFISVPEMFLYSWYLQFPSGLFALRSVCETPGVKPWPGETGEATILCPNRTLIIPKLNSKPVSEKTQNIPRPTQMMKNA